MKRDQLIEIMKQHVFPEPIMGHVKSAHDLACQLRRRLAK